MEQHIPTPKKRKTKKEAFEERMYKATERHIGHEVAFTDPTTRLTRTGKLLRLGQNNFGSLMAYLDVNQMFPAQAYFAELQSCQCGKYFTWCDSKGHYFQDGEDSPCECKKFKNLEEGKAKTK